MQRKKKAAFNLSDSSKQHSSEHWSPARHLWTNLALSCVAGTHSFEKQYKNRLMQNQAMEITAGRAMRHRAILGDFASPDSQIAIETGIIGVQNRTILLQCDRALSHSHKQTTSEFPILSVSRLVLDLQAKNHNETTLCNRALFCPEGHYLSSVSQRQQQNTSQQSMQNRMWIREHAYSRT